MGKTLLFELIVPCFNEAESLPALIERTVQAAGSQKMNPEEFQLVLVNNGSTDRTAEVLAHYQRGPLGIWLKVVTLQKNLGYGGGIHAGLCASRAPWVGYSHADLQCEPLNAFQAFQLAFQRGGHTLARGIRSHRSWGAWLNSRCYELVVGLFWGFWCFELNAQPKVFHRTLMNNWEEPPSGITFDAFVLLQANKNKFQRVDLKVELKHREHGESHWASSLGKRVKTYLRILRELNQLSSKVR